VALGSWIVWVSRIADDDEVGAQPSTVKPHRMAKAAFSMNMHRGSLVLGHV
jgi:hypothetical protein